MRMPNLDIYEGLPDHTMLRAKDVVNVFGYKGGQGSVSTHVKKNLIPEPSKKLDDFTPTKKYGYRNTSKERINSGNLRFWKLGDLRKLKLEMETKS